MSHIVGKVYDLTQENMQKIIAELESIQNDYRILISQNSKLWSQLESLKGTLEEIESDMYIGYKKSCECPDAAKKALNKIKGDAK